MYAWDLQAKHGTSVQRLGLMWLLFKQCCTTLQAIPRYTARFSGEVHALCLEKSYPDLLLKPNYEFHQS